MRTGPGTTELREFPMPDIPGDGALQWCRIGEYRHCALTDWRLNPDARRYGYTTSDNPYHLWGGFAEYLFLPWNPVLHRVPDGVSAELAGIATPLSNGIEWVLFSAGVGYDSTVLIQGPGQQELSQTVACKLASGRFPLHELVTHRFGLGHADRAIRAVGGEAGEDVVHVSLLPWED